MSNDNGGPAFPTGVYTVEGMTLRDYFAAKAMQGILANSEANRSWTDDDIAKFAYGQAYAMIAERNKAK